MGNLSLLTLITLVCCVELSPVLLLLLLWTPELGRESMQGVSNTGYHSRRSPITLLATPCFLTGADGFPVQYTALSTSVSLSPVVYMLSLFFFSWQRVLPFSHLSSESDREGNLRKSKQHGQSEPGLQLREVLIVPLASSGPVRGSVETGTLEQKRLRPTEKPSAV